MVLGQEQHDRHAVAGVDPQLLAQVAVFIAIGVLEKCFPGELTASAWLPKLKEIIPSYGVSLIADVELCRRVRADTAQILKIENIDPPAVAVRSARDSLVNV